MVLICWERRYYFKRSVLFCKNKSFNITTSLRASRLNNKSSIPFLFICLFWYKTKPYFFLKGKKRISSRAFLSFPSKCFLFSIPVKGALSPSLNLFGKEATPVPERQGPKEVVLQRKNALIEFLLLKKTNANGFSNEFS